MRAYGEPDSRNAVYGSRHGASEAAFASLRESRQSGQRPHLLRGVVTFEWREDGEVVRRARKRTTANHPGTKGSDPVGFSAATCTIS